MSDSDRDELVNEIVAKVRREIAQPADQIADAVLRRIRRKVAVVPRRQVLELDADRAPRRRAS